MGMKYIEVQSTSFSLPSPARSVSGIVGVSLNVQSILTILYIFCTILIWMLQFFCDYSFHLNNSSFSTQNLFERKSKIKSNNRKRNLKKSLNKVIHFHEPKSNMKRAFKIHYAIIFNLKANSTWCRQWQIQMLLENTQNQAKPNQPFFNQKLELNPIPLKQLDVPRFHD